MYSTVVSDVGTVRSNNQDSAFAGEHLIAICDGMGGHAGGDTASTIAIRSLAHIEQDNVDGDVQVVSHMMATSVMAAHDAIVGKAKRERRLAGMGTTAVCALVRAGQAFLCHAGDSRAYLYRDGKLTQLTHDHSYVQELVDCGTITVEEAEHHPQKNIITKALGVDYRLEPEFTTVALQAGDVLLLCTDGLTNAVPMEQLEQLLRSGSFYDLPDALIRTANENGGPDNITALLVGIEPMEVRHG